MNKADAARFRKLQDLGCVACLEVLDLEALGEDLLAEWGQHIDSLKSTGGYREPDIHHVLAGGRRQGHQATVPLCPWHHRGVVQDPFQDQREAERVLGPSMALSPAGFREKFGSQEELLEFTNALLEAIR